MSPKNFWRKIAGIANSTHSGLFACLSIRMASTIYSKMFATIPSSIGARISSQWAFDKNSTIPFLFGYLFLEDVLFFLEDELFFGYLFFGGCTFFWRTSFFFGKLFFSVSKKNFGVILFLMVYKNLLRCPQKIFGGK